MATYETEAHPTKGGAVNPAKPGRLSKIIDLFLRIAAVVLTIIVIAVMVNAKQTKLVLVLPQVFVPLKAKWQNSKAFVALVVVSAICLAYSFIQFIAAILRLGSGMNNRGMYMVTFIADQILAYALIATAGAATEVAYIAKKGVPSAGWGKVCSGFGVFCTRAGFSIIFSYIAFLALAGSSIISAYHLFRSRV